MDIIYVLVPLSIVLIGIATLVFFWAVRSGQFDDMDSPAHKILFDDDDPIATREKPSDAPNADTDSKKPHDNHNQPPL